MADGAAAVELAMDKVRKKQRTDPVGPRLDEMVGLLRGWLDEHPSPSAHDAAEVEALVRRLEASAPPDAKAEAHEHHKELSTLVGKLGKAIDKAAPPRLDLALPGLAFAPRLMDEAIFSHLLSVGLFDVAETLRQEARLESVGGRPCAQLAAQLRELHAACAAMGARDARPAIEWTARHAARLTAGGAALRFMLHRLQFGECLAAGDSRGALEYLRSQLAEATAREAAAAAEPLDDPRAQLRRLAGAIAFAGRLRASPYAELVAPARWAHARERLAADGMRMLGLCRTPPLLELVDAGAIALPRLHKLATVLQTKYEAAVASRHLPIEVDLGPRFQHHSVFCCPVSREVSSAGNLPSMLPCGHVISAESLAKLARGSRNLRFKCPYCPSESTLGAALALTL